LITGVFEGFLILDYLGACPSLMELPSSGHRAFRFNLFCPKLPCKKGFSLQSLAHNRQKNRDLSKSQFIKT
jgi:hypothetical protein